MRRLLLALAAALVAVVLVVVVRTVRTPSRQRAPEPAAPFAVDPGAVGRFARSLEFRTVSHQDPAAFDGEQFTGFHRYLEECFPRVHATLRRDVVADYSLLFSWRGRDSDRPPGVLLAHLDVVPAADEGWTHPPFAGRIADGYVWGRGALDDKASVLAILEALETLIAQGFSPRRSTYVAFGHDEEVGGNHGAAALARLLGGRTVPAEYVLDEGLAVTEGVVPAMSRPVALVGIAEKGYLTLELTVRGEGGHSSTPPAATPIGILAAAVAALETHPPPAAIEGAVRRLLEFVGPETNLATRAALANLWLFGGLVERRLAAAPASAALIRTTVAPTMVEGGVKENLLPAVARAVVNFRIRPGESIDGVTAWARRTIADARVEIRPLPPTTSEPSPASPVDNQAFALLQRTVGQIFPDAVVAPSLVVGATDARHYANLGTNVYRFLPVRVRPDDLRRAHGVDERLAVRDYEGAVRFYAQLIRNADEYGARLAPKAQP
jgi:carboxypeptidase PM20D1